MFFLWMAVASAGVKEVSLIGQTEWIPVTPIAADSVSGGPLCLTWNGAGLPTVQRCPGGVSEVYGPLATGAGSGAALGVVSLSPGWLGARSVDRPVGVAVEAAWSSVLRSPARGSLSDADIAVAADWCRGPASGAVVVEAAVGCSRTALLAAYDPSVGPVALKEFSDRWVDHVEGGWRSDGAKATTCAGPAKIVMVRVIPASHVCAVDVMPRALGMSEVKLASFKASPDAVSEPLKDLFGLLAQMKGLSKEIHSSLQQVDIDLAQAKVDLGEARGRSQGFSMSDDRWIGLLTRMERLDADVSEFFVASASQHDRLVSMQSEMSALEEKAAQPGMDAMLVQRLGTQIAYVIENLQGVEADVNGLIVRVASARQGVGYLQGGLEVGLGPAPSK